MPRINFEYPENTSYSEMVELNISFKEISIRGSKDVKYRVEASDNSQIVLTYYFHVSSWKALKKAYPTLESILEYFGKSPYWEASSFHHDRILWIGSIEGHEGLYTVGEDAPFIDLMEINKKEVEATRKRLNRQRKS
jgi:hypothetical protein